MNGRDVVPLPLGGEVLQDGGVEPSHPRVRVRAHHAVLGVLGRLLGRDRWAFARGHGRKRTPALAAGALVVGAALTGLTLTPAAVAEGTQGGGDGGAGTFTVGILNEVDSFNPFLGIEAESYEMWA